MSQKKVATTLLFAAAGVFFTTRADAHIEVASGVATANSTNVVTFGVGHGCAGQDTYRVTIDIPAGVTSVRPMRSDFGTPSVQKDNTGAVTSVSWQKPDTEALDTDFAYYTLVVRLKVPDQPFSTLYFVAHQTCRAADGTLTTVDWADTPSTPPDAGTGEPAAALKLVPARLPGWNKYTVAAAMTDLSVFFKDAQIVWQGTAAFSANPNIMSLIMNTSGVSALSALSAGDEIWVKY
jgi:uncharacterized protein YcnI